MAFSRLHWMAHWDCISDWLSWNSTNGAGLGRPKSAFIFYFLLSFGNNLHLCLISFICHLKLVKFSATFCQNKRFKFLNQLFLLSRSCLEVSCRSNLLHILDPTHVWTLKRNFWICLNFWLSFLWSFQWKSLRFLQKLFKAFGRRVQNLVEILLNGFSACSNIWNFLTPQKVWLHRIWRLNVMLFLLVKSALSFRFSLVIGVISIAFQVVLPLIWLVVWVAIS